MTRTITATTGKARKMADPNITKLSQVKAFLESGDTTSALRMAAKFPRLGDHKERITRAWAAHSNPETYAAMGWDVAAVVADGIVAIRERFDIAGEAG
jgi:hypothetical protein